MITNAYRSRPSLAYQPAHDALLPGDCVSCIACIVCCVHAYRFCVCDAFCASVLCKSVCVCLNQNAPMGTPSVAHSEPWSCQHLAQLAQSAVAHGHLPVLAPHRWPKLRFGRHEFTECLSQLACGLDSNLQVLRQKANHVLMSLELGNVVLTTADLCDAYIQMGCLEVPWASWDYIDRKPILQLQQT